MTERPDRPLVVKCAYDSTSRRIAFPSASKCRLTALRARASECFHLSALSFHFIYIDDDGEEFDIREEADLTEAILYFEGGGDDASIRSGAQGQLAKVQIKVEVVVEYDGPSLSDTSSLRSYSDEGLDGEGEGEEWGSSYYTESWGSSISGLSTRPSERDRRTYEESTAGPSRYMEGRDQVYNGVRQTQLDPDYGDDEVTEYAGARDEQAGLSMYDLSLADGPQQSTLRPLPPLTGPDSAPAPALLTHSELGSRWLKEQKDLAKRKLPRLVHGAPSTGHRGSRIWDSDSDSLGSDERVGDIALVKDERGRESSGPLQHTWLNSRVLLLLRDGITTLATPDGSIFAPSPSATRHTRAGAGHRAWRSADSRARLLGVRGPARAHAICLHDVRRR